jgi:hypothetical protein
VEVNGVGELGILFGAGSGAAPECVEGLAESLPVARGQRQVVHHGAVFGIDGAQAVVEEPLFRSNPSGRHRGPSEQVPRQLHHVVGATVFGRIGAELGCQFSRIGIPGFVIAGATGAIGALADHLVPEILGDVTVAAVAGEFVICGRRQSLAGCAC